MEVATNICGLCSQAFSDLSQLLTHLNAHQALQTSWCHTCGQTRVIVMTPAYLCTTCSLSPAPTIYDTPRSTQVVTGLEEALQVVNVSTDSCLGELTATGSNPLPPIISEVGIKPELEHYYIDISNCVSNSDNLEGHTQAQVTSAVNHMYHLPNDNNDYITMTSNLAASYQPVQYHSPDENWRDINNGRNLLPRGQTGVNSIELVQISSNVETDYINMTGNSAASGQAVHQISDPMYSTLTENAAAAEDSPTLPPFGTLSSHTFQWPVTKSTVGDYACSTVPTEFGTNSTVPHGFSNTTFKQSFSAPQTQTPCKTPLTVSRRVKGLFKDAIGKTQHKREEVSPKLPRVYGRYGNYGLGCVCYICNKQLLNDLDLMAHIKSVHGEYKYTCPLCTVKYVCATSTRRHMRTKHSDLFEADKGLVFNTIKFQRHKLNKDGKGN